MPKKKTTANKVYIKFLYFSNLTKYSFFQLFLLFSLIWFFLGAFLFLVCFSIPVLLLYLRHGITNERIQYAKNKKTY